MQNNERREHILEKIFQKQFFSILSFAFRP